MSETVYIGIGSNLGDPRKNCRQAIERINAHPDITVTTRSSLYETEPLGLKEQGWFVNAVVAARTTLPPRDLLQALLVIEKEMGRVRRQKWGPRLIDLDLLYYGDQRICSDNLEVPHPEVHRRKFVLVPLNEIDPKRLHPVLNKTARELLAELPENQKINRISNLP